MLISRETDYAIRILRKVSDGEKYSVREICQSEKIPQQFGYKIVDKLQKAGYVKCTRGVTGGCVLTADLDQVTLYELLDALEDKFHVNECLKPGTLCELQLENDGKCKTHMKLIGLQIKIDNMLKDMKISALV